MILFSLLFSLSSQGACLEGRGTEAAVSVQNPYADLSRIRVPSGTETLIIVAAGGEQKNATGELFLYERSEGKNSWQEVLSGVPAKLGRGGVGKTVEGDQKTPLGMFSMNTPFGIRDAEAGFPGNYIKVNSSHYWSAEKATYNRLCTVEKDGAYTSSSEHLIDYSGYYDYCIDIGYNPERTAGKGSDLFLHCEVNGQNTGGCIAIPSEHMKTILRHYAEGGTVIVIENKGNFEKYY